MLEIEGVNNLIPGINNIKEGEELYLKIPNYTERESQYGVLAFKIEISNNVDKVINEKEVQSL